MLTAKTHTSVAWSLAALILALNLRDAGTSPLTWTYAVATMVGYYGLPLLVVATALFLVLIPFRP